MKTEFEPITNKIGVYDWIKDLLDNYPDMSAIYFDDISNESEWDYQIKVAYTKDGCWSETVAVLNVGKIARVNIDKIDKFYDATLMIARAIRKNPRGVEFNHKEKTIKLFDSWELHKWIQYRFVDDFTDKYKEIYNLYKSKDLTVIGDEQ